MVSSHSPFCQVFSFIKRLTLSNVLFLSNVQLLFYHILNEIKSSLAGSFFLHLPIFLASLSNYTTNFQLCQVAHSSYTFGIFQLSQLLDLPALEPPICSSSHITILYGKCFVYCWQKSKILRSLWKKSQYMWSKSQIARFLWNKSQGLWNKSKRVYKRWDYAVIMQKRGF